MRLSTSGRHSLFGWAAWPVIAICLLLCASYTHEMITHMGKDYEIIRHDVELFRSDPMTLYRPEVLQSTVGFVYPPPSVLVFVPFSLLPYRAGYLAFVAFVLLAIVTAIVLWLRILRRSGTLSPPIVAADWLALVAIGLTARPMYDAIVQGQIDPVVLALCVGYVVCMRSRLPALGGSLLAIGCWIKIYPVLLLVDVIRNAERRRCLLGFAATAILIPLVALPVVPASLYVRYFTAALPALSSQAVTNIYNQSAAAFIGRLSVPLHESLTVFEPHPVSLVTRITILVALVAALILMMKRARPEMRDVLLLPASVMALIAPVAPLGWGHTYVYLVPLLYLTGISALTKRAWGTIAAWGAILVAITIPAHHHFPEMTFLPQIAADLLYSRYLFATLALLLFAWRLNSVSDTVASDWGGASVAAAESD